MNASRRRSTAASQRHEEHPTRLGYRPENPRCVDKALRDECAQASPHRSCHRREEIASDWVVAPKNHAVFASSCAMDVPKSRSTALANVAKSIASDRVAAPKAHAVLARSCAINASRRRSTALARAARSIASDWVAVPILRSARTVGTD